MAKVNRMLVSLTLRDVQIAGKGTSVKSNMGLFFNALQSNVNLPLENLDIQGTTLDTPSAHALAGYVSSRDSSFMSLNLSGAVSKSDIKLVLGAFLKNPNATYKLKTLNWSNTRFADYTVELGDVLMKCSALMELKLQETNVSIATLVGKIRNHCKKLEKLDFSHNKLGKNDAWNGLAELLQADAHCIYELDISDTQVPVSVLQQILMINEGNVAIIAAENNLGPQGARMIGDIAGKITCVDHLDLADNGFGDTGLATLIEGLCNNSSLTHLNLSLNYKESSDKHRQKCLHQLVLLASSICPIEVLILRGGSGRKIGPSIESFLYALAENSTCTELDVSGHGFGDTGAIALARVLQQNQVLQNVFYDDNQIGTIGFLNIADAVSSNKNLRVMPVPFSDVASLLAGMKDSGEKEQLSKVLTKMERDLSSRQYRV